MFSLAPDASKLALIALAKFCYLQGFEMIDCQVTNNHLLNMGAVQLPREDFLKLLEKALEKPSIKGAWTLIFEETIGSQS